MIRRGVENSRILSEGLAFSDIRCADTGEVCTGGGEAEGVISGGLAGDAIRNNYETVRTGN